MIVDVAAVITALGGFAAAIIGALVLLGKLLADVKGVRHSLSPNGGGSLHDAIRRIEAKQDDMAGEISSQRDLDRQEHARLWSAIRHPITTDRRKHRPWRKR